jgi:hypothetical protein
MRLSPILFSRGAGLTSSARPPQTVSCDPRGRKSPAVAAKDRFVKLSAGLTCLAPASQWLHAPGSRFRRPRREHKKAEVVRVYLPPDVNVNCLLSVMDHCLRSRHYVNVVIAGKHPAPQWLTMDAALKHCTEGIGIWP